MPNDDFSPELNKLDGDYQVLTELHGEGDARTYLARHLGLNRDVTISAFHAAGGNTDALAQFASDTHVLTEARHPHVVPVIDGVWLDEETFASVRARIRGATLDQLLGASGPMSIARVAATLHDIVEAIVWARETGIERRDVAPWDVVFQQGTGRVMLSFEPMSDSASPRTECDDAQTARRLAIEMLSGEIDRGVPAEEIAVRRSLPTHVADALSAMRHCDSRTAVTAMNALLEALDSARSPVLDKKTEMIVAPAPPVVSLAVIQPVHRNVEREVPTVVQRAADVPKGPLSVITRVPSHRASSNRGDGAAVLSKPSFGFNARLATAIVVVAVAGVGAFVYLNRDEAKMTNVAIIAPRDTGTSASGEVVLRSRSQSQPQTIPTTTRRGLAPARSGLDSVAAVERAYRRDSAADAASPCLSADSAKQHQCLTTSIAKNDRQLNAVYARLVAALSQRSNASAIDELNAAQEKWSDDRDSTCGGVGDEPLFAKSRAACYAQKATDRARELQRRLDSLPPE